MSSHIINRLLWAILLASATLLPTACGDTSADPPATSAQPSSAAVAISSVTPEEIKASETVTITGSGFGDSKGTSTLTVGGVPADTIISWSDTEIQAAVPDNALTGAVKATVQEQDSEEKKLVVLWDNENPENVIIPGNTASPLQMQILAEGVGGSIIVWNDFRYSDPTIFAQRLNSRGKIQWAPDGVALSSATGGQYFPQLVEDSNGGAIVVWQDYRSGLAGGYDVYAQRVHPDGSLLWAADAAICTTAEDQQKPKIAADGNGGAIIAWYDHRNNTGYNSGFQVFTQRIDADGILQWTTNGIAIATTDNPQNPYNEIIADGSGGAIIVWQDYRSGAWQIYAQRIDSAGAIQWPANGILVSAGNAANQVIARPVPDGEGGAIIVWKSSGGDLYAQRISGDGNLLWGSDVPVSAAPGDQTLPQMIPDGSGGAIIAWEDCRAGSAIRDIYAQRLDASGVALWTTDGVAVSTAAAAQYAPQLVTNGRGGAIITWYDYRNYNLPLGGTIQGIDTYAQHLNAEGVAQWTPDGIAISAASLHQKNPVIATDNSGGAIIVWEDSRSVSAVDVYAQGISFNGKQ